ncbi:MAG: protein MalT [Desulfamplus sp.]|nr:protein MalT [Desulfamplus sp.]
MSNSRTFALPQVHDVIARKSLYKFLDSNQDKRVVLVQGQAAQGKSTLVASYLNRFSSQSESRIIPVWLHLGQGESDHTSLFDLMTNALLQRIPDQDAGRLTRKVTASPATLGTCEDIARQVDIIISIFDLMSNPVALVIDNLESIDSNASSWALIQSIISHTCETAQGGKLFLISRKFPPVNISRLKLEHRSLILANDDLAFTLEETGQFLENHCGNTLSSELIRKIHTITEGWPGGVALISESISRDVDISSFPLHLTAETFDYFSREIYALLPESIKHFLLRASMFDEIDEDMATELCDPDNGHEILTYLEKRNLFIQRLTSSQTSHKASSQANSVGLLPYHDRNMTRMAGRYYGSSSRHLPVCYRFNTLFKQFLFKALIHEISSDELKLLSKRAAHFFEKRGEIELSVRYYLDAEDYKMASDMIKKCATDILVRGLSPNLGTWIESLPETVVQSDPWLIYYLTVTRRIRGGRRNVDDFLTALRLFGVKNDIRGCMLATAHLIEAAVFVRKSPSRIFEWIKYGEDILARERDNPHFSWARALLWQHIAFGYIAGEVDIHKGLSSCKNAMILAKRIANSEIELNASIVMAFGYVRTGNFLDAKVLLKDIKPLTNEDINPEYRALNHLVRIDFALKQGAFDDAQKYLHDSEKDLEKFGLIFLYPGFIELKAMHRIYTGRFRGATSLAGHLSDFSILSGNTFYLALAHHIKAIIHYHTDCQQTPAYDDPDRKNKKYTLFESAMAESEKSLKTLREQKGEDARFFAAQALNGLILMKQKNYTDAQESLEQALDYFAAVSSGILWCETEAALGLLFWKKSQPALAKEYILKSLNRAFQQGYERFSLMAPSDFAEIVLLGICLDDSNTLFSALSPLIANKSHSSNEQFGSNVFTGNRVDLKISSLLKHPLLAADMNALDRLRHIYRLLLPRIDITTLGQFSVCVNNKPVADNTWDGNKPKLLLKSIICHNTKDISKEMIIDDIWPDASVKAGEKNFKVNLHRLRKTLEPDVNKQVGYSYLTMDTGRVSLDPELVTVDIDTFNTLAQQGYEKLARDEVALALLFFEQAVAIYKGDFLAEEPYETWIDLKREILRTYYIEILMIIARIHEDQDQPFQAVEYLKKAIQADPLREEAYQNLMIVYADSGMLTAATALYEKWRQVARSELGVEPGPETCNIYNKIQAIHLKNSRVVQFKKR